MIDIRAQIALLFVAVILLYFMLYTIIDRICKCVENVHKLKTYGKALEYGGETKGTSEEGIK